MLPNSKYGRLLQDFVIKILKRVIMQNSLPAASGDSLPWLPSLLLPAWFTIPIRWQLVECDREGECQGNREAMIYFQ